MFQLITYTLQYKIIICSIEKKLCVRISVCMHKNWSEVVKVYGSPHLSSIKEMVIHKLCNIMTWLPPNNVLLPYSYLKAVTSQTSYGLSISVEWDKPMKTYLIIITIISLNISLDLFLKEFSSFSGAWWNLHWHK